MKDGRGLGRHMYLLLSPTDRSTERRGGRAHRTPMTMTRMTGRAGGARAAAAAAAAGLVLSRSVDALHLTSSSSPSGYEMGER